MTSNFCTEKDSDVIFDCLIDNEHAFTIRYDSEQSFDIDTDNFYASQSGYVQIQAYVNSIISNGKQIMKNVLSVNSGYYNLIVPEGKDNTKNNLIVDTGNYVFGLGAKLISKSKQQTVVIPETIINNKPTTRVKNSLIVTMPDIIMSGSGRKAGYYYVSDWDNTYWGAIDNLYLSDIEYYEIA
jgi:hypothetical protein